MEFDLTKRFTKERRAQFAGILKQLDQTIGFKVSSRGWCYIMEQKGYINKNQFDKVDNAINDCRKQGLLPVDFVAEEKAREFSGVERPKHSHIVDTLDWMLRDALNGSIYYTPEWWYGEEYYIQVVVEKIDLVTLFEPVCKQYKIPIANAKGWSSILQRAEYARRFKEAEDNGLKCVLLYFGDHDPDGLRISDTIRKNLEQIQEIHWDDGEDGYDPSELIIDRAGLNYDYIIANNFTWIDNLITGSGGNLASPKHPNYELPYVQEYLRTIGERKCESNVIVTRPREARQLITKAIEKYLGPGAPDRFQEKRNIVKKRYLSCIKQTGLYEPLSDYFKGKIEVKDPGWSYHDNETNHDWTGEDIDDIELD